MKFRSGNPDMDDNWKQNCQSSKKLKKDCRRLEIVLRLPFRRAFHSGNGHLQSLRRQPSRVNKYDTIGFLHSNNTRAMDGETPGRGKTPSKQEKSPGERTVKKLLGRRRPNSSPFKSKKRSSTPRTENPATNKVYSQTPSTIAEVWTDSCE